MQHFLYLQLAHVCAYVLMCLGQLDLDFCPSAAGLKEPSVPGLSHEAALFLDRVFHNAPRALPDHYLSFSLDHKQFFYTHKMTGAVQWVSTQEGLDQRVQEVRHALPLAGQHSQHTAPPMAPIEDALSPTSPMPTLEQLTD
eukprot:m.290872 g.290872  ORF g.290872 m.290872 type:complete len:141 (-) comp15820_c1_seq2:165-587(-)